MIDVRSVPQDWMVLKTKDIILLTHEGLEPERWRFLVRYVMTVCKPIEPHWSEGPLGFGFVGVGEDPLKISTHDT